jgi:AraC-like DNA-binding protein
MIHTLDGTKEIVSYEGNSTILLYTNDKAENYPNHWHTPLEIIMPLVDSYRAVCNNTTYDLRVGDVLLIAPGTLHRLYAPSSGKRIIFQAELSAFSNIKEFDTALTLASPALLITPEQYLDIHHEIAILLSDIKNEYDTNAPMKDIFIYSKLFQIIALIGRCNAGNSGLFTDEKSGKQEEYIDKFHFICDYINQNCTDNLSLNAIANIAGFSKYYFSRLFKEFTNLSFYRYLSIRRIAYAEKLLADPQMNITDIAFKSGFNNLSAFIRMFRIVKNCTPTEFRNMYRS